MGRLVFACLLLLAACNDDLPKPEEIEDLRVLGVRSEPPDGPPGTIVELEALVVTPEPEAIDTAWLACAGGTSDPRECVNLAGGELPPPCSAQTGAPVCLLGLGDPDPYVLPGGVSQALIVLLAAESDQGGLFGCQAELLDEGTIPAYCRVALKRIPIVESLGDRNANPGLDAIAIDGEAVSVTLSTGASETTPDGPEALFLSWFVTSGELDSFRTDGDAEGLSNRWTEPAMPGRIFVVVRDGRGGESWISSSR
jgi:hypothetical protein